MAQNALDAYKSLIPDNLGSIEFWYFNHGATAYGGYFPSSGTTYRAYFNWRRGDSTPAFGSDATGSIAWDGLNNTLSVTISPSAKPEDYST